MSIIIILLQAYYKTFSSDKKPFRTLAFLLNFGILGSAIVIVIIVLAATLSPDSGSSDCEHCDLV